MSKLMSAAEAVSRFVKDGDTIYAGYTTVSYALCYELIRQQRKEIEIVGASIGLQGSLWFYSGVANRVKTGYIGGALRPGVVQDMMRDGRLKYEDYTNQNLALMLMAGALGMPFVPTRSLLGTDYLLRRNLHHPGGYEGEKKLYEMESPFNGERVVLLPAVKPDVTLYHCQWADEDGNVINWGAHGDARWGMWAAKHTIVSVEEIVPREVTRSDPNRVVVPGFKVSAVVHAPWGAHPTAVAGYYDNDYAFMRNTGIAQVSSEALDGYLADWVHGCPDRESYIRKYVEVFGEGQLDNVRAKGDLRPIREINYAYAPDMTW
jgi:glutaconate CoA-transferase subunit A